MNQKLSKLPSRLLPSCATITPVALSLFASSFTFGQSVHNRYAVPNPYQTYPTTVYQNQPVTIDPAVQQHSLSVAPQHPYEVRSGYSVPLHAPAMRYVPHGTPTTNGYETIPPQRIQSTSQPFPQTAPNSSAPLQSSLRSGAVPAANAPAQIPRPAVQAIPNIADIQDVGRGLGTPGLITAGSAERMEQSGLVIEDFRPPQPKAEDFSLEGLPPEARRSFYEQLQIPAGGRVMSARVVPADGSIDPQASKAVAVEPNTIATAPRSDEAPIAATAPAKSDPIPATTQQPNELHGQTAMESPNAGSASSSTTSDQTKAIPVDVVDRSLESKDTVKTGQIDPIRSEVDARERSLADIQEAISKQQSSFDEYLKSNNKILQEIVQQNTELKSQLDSMSDRLAKLEASHSELESKLKSMTESGKQPEPPLGEKGDPTEKKSKKKGKDRIEL